MVHQWKCRSGKYPWNPQITLVVAEGRGRGSRVGWGEGRRDAAVNRHSPFVRYTTNTYVLIR
ncbi:hypothetical protein E2C01_052587 [Portunus trituberculatus]|uniref:Uncharacterized protein n=1 Tax=Portunus trituberculatus TaxID=210409 RepID=A0A5B7GE45_PORTR|nr:hypothetical protein [Portunus trituberculatus]